jgi:hypothetical protein
MVNTAYEQAGNVDPLYLYMEDGSNKTVYARPGNPTNTSQGLFGIDHNDNSTNPDEHVWKITWVAGNNYIIQNTVLDGPTTKYFGEFGSVYGSTSTVRQHTIPQIECVPFSSPSNPSDDYYLNLIGQNADYNAFHYVVNTLYHYVDFYTLNSSNYDLSKTKFHFEAI